MQTYLPVSESRMEPPFLSQFAGHFVTPRHELASKEFSDVDLVYKRLRRHSQANIDLTKKLMPANSNPSLRLVCTINNRCVVFIQKLASGCYCNVEFRRRARQS